MKSKTSFFNKGIFNHLLKRYWPAWALYAIVWLLAMPIEFLSSIRYSENVAAAFVCRINAMCDGGMTVAMAFVCAIIVATGIFSFMYRQRETSMVASLPVKREAVFCSAYLAGLLPLVAINAIIAVLTLLTAAGHINCECVTAVLIWFGSYSIEFIAFYGIACIIAMLTGSIVALPILYVIFNFLAPAIEFLIRSLIDVFVYGLSTIDDLVTGFLSPAIYMTENTQACYTNGSAYYNDTTGKLCPQMMFEGWGVIAIYAAVGLLLAVCALLLYRKRKMECTGDVVAIPVLKPVFKYGVALCAAIGLGLLIYLIFWESSIATACSNWGVLIGIIVSMAIGGAIGYFGADMLLKKSVHVFRGNWSGYIAVAAVCAALCLVCRFDVFGLGRYVPDESKIEYVRLTGSYTDVKLTEADDINAATVLHKSIVANLGEIAKENSGMFDMDNEEYYYTVNFEYVLKNGKTVNRAYAIKENRDEAKQYVEFMESDTVRKARCAEFAKYTADDVNNASLSYCVRGMDWYGCELTGSQAIDLYKNAIEADILEGNMNLKPYTDENDNYPTMWIEFDSYGQNGMYEFAEFSGTITPECVHTVQWFKDNFGVDVCGEINEPIVNNAVIESVEYVG